MATENDYRYELLRNITEFCDGKDCGDPIVTIVANAPVAFTRRRMDFRGFAFTFVRPPIASYVCPQCGCRRTFTTEWFSTRVVCLERRPCSPAHQRT